MSRANRFAENAQTARQDFGCSFAVPGRLGPQGRVVVLVLARLRGDGVDDLPVAERVAVPAEVRLQVHGGLGDPRADDEPQPGVVQVVQVGGRQHAGVGDHDHALDPVPRLELPDHRQDRVLLRLVPLIAADLQGEPVPVHQQPDHDLRVHPPFFRVADLAQVVLVLGLEVQRRHVIQDQGDIAAGPDVREAQLGDLVPVAAARAAGQGAAHRLVAGRLAAQFRQDPAGVQDRGRLHDPGQDQVPEHVIAQGAEPQVP